MASQIITYWLLHHHHKKYYFYWNLKNANVFNSVHFIVGFAKIAQILIDKGANINVSNFGGDSGNLNNFQIGNDITMATEL